MTSFNGLGMNPGALADIIYPCKMILLGWPIGIKACQRVPFPSCLTETPWRLSNKIGA
jgi:hypothetical protein